MEEQGVGAAASAAVAAVDVEASAAVVAAVVAVVSAHQEVVAASREAVVVVVVHREVAAGVDSAAVVDGVATRHDCCCSHHHAHVHIVRSSDRVPPMYRLRALNLFASKGVSGIPLSVPVMIHQKEDSHEENTLITQERGTASFASQCALPLLYHATPSEGRTSTRQLREPCGSSSRFRGCFTSRAFAPITGSSHDPS